MTERDKLSKEFKKLREKLNNVSRKIKQIDNAHLKEKYYSKLGKCYKVITDFDTIRYYFIYAIVDDNDGTYQYNTLYINDLKEFQVIDGSDVRAFESDMTDDGYITTEISKEEFTNEYAKVILHYNTLINGTQDSI